MRRFEDIALKNVGNAVLVLAGATVTVRVSNPASPGTGALATIYSDDGVTTIAGSAVTVDSVGRFSFYAPDGKYDLTVSGTGVATPYTQADVEISDVTERSTSDTGWTVDTQTVGKLNNVLYVDGVKYAQTGAGIQSAITAACALSPVGTVYVTPGTYSVTTPITDCAGLKLLGWGPSKSARLSATAGVGAGNGIVVISSDDVEVAGLYFDGNNAVSGIIGIQITTASKAHVHDNFIDEATYGIRLESDNAHIRIHNNVIGNGVGTQYGILGLQMNNSFDIEICHNILLGNQNAASSGLGIAMDGGTATIGQEPHDINIHHNYVTGYTQSGAGGIAIGAARVIRGFVMDSNIVIGNLEGLRVEDEADGFVITGNYAYGNTRGGINIVATSVGGRPRPRYGTIAGNVAIANGPDAGFAGIGCVGTGPCTGMTFTGNTAKDNLGAGFITGTLTDGSFIGNEATGNTPNYTHTAPATSLIANSQRFNFLSSASTGTTVATFGRDTTNSSSFLNINYTNATDQALAFRNTNAGGRVWSIGDGIGASAGDFGFYDQTGAALRGSLTSAGKWVSSQVESTIATGTAPLIIASTTKVSNLNVDKLDDADWAAPAAIGTGTPAAGTFTILTATGALTAETFNSETNCSSSASPAVCVDAAAGSVVIAAAATSVVVNTTKVTANSQILITEDSSLGTKLSVTCNTTIGRNATITARSAATSFTINVDVAPVTNPMCLSYWIVN